MKFTRYILYVSIITILAGCSGYATALHIHERNNFYELHVPVSKLALTIPMEDGFVKKENRQGGGTENPRYFYFINERKRIILSGWFESAEAFPGTHKLWENLIQEYKRRGDQPPQNINFEKIGGWDCVIYEIPNQKPLNTHMTAHWVQKGTWIEAHFSITSADPITAKSQLTALLKRIQVTEI